MKRYAKEYYMDDRCLFAAVRAGVPVDALAMTRSTSGPSTTSATCAQ